MSVLIDERRLRRVMIRPEYMLDWMRDAMTVGEGRWVQLPVLDGLPVGYHVVSTFSDPTMPPNIYIVVAHQSFDPVPCHEAIPILSAGVNARMVAIQLTEEQAKALRDVAANTGGTRRPKML